VGVEKASDFELEFIFKEKYRIRMDSGIWGGVEKAQEFELELI
jgi:hypothetical protein